MAAIDTRRARSLALLFPIGVAVAFIAGMWAGPWLMPRHTGVAGGAAGKLATVLQMIDAQYVDPINRDSLIEVTIPDLLSHLDPHSIYIPAAELQATNDELAGSFSGIGVTFQMTSDTITVIEVLSGGPAEKAGLMPGDRIVTIDDSVAAGRGWTTTKVMSSLRGPAGTEVHLGIRRSTARKTLSYTLTRGDIPVTSIDAAYMLEPATGYVKVNKFGAQTYSEFLTAMTQLRADGAESYIIDLRGNGGGFMEPAILMANEFLPAGARIVSTRGRVPGQDNEIAADGMGSFGRAQLVVLLDEYSASASEIFAGAIQDNDRGLIVGRRSFGKGLVQNQLTLPDSSALRLTVARYYTPSGRCIQKTYTPGNLESYNTEILERYAHGENLSADSARINPALLFRTLTGRNVYGGGGIMPDVFVPDDTARITSWYLNVINAALLQKYAFEFTDLNRAELSAADDIDGLRRLLPPDDELLYSFVQYAVDNHVPAKWGLINISAPLVVNQLKALIARDALRSSAFYEIFNTDDPVIIRALDELRRGAARPPLMPASKTGSAEAWLRHSRPAPRTMTITHLT